MLLNFTASFSKNVKKSCDNTFTQKLQMAKKARFSSLSHNVSELPPPLFLPTFSTVLNQGSTALLRYAESLSGSSKNITHMEEKTNAFHILWAEEKSRVTNISQEENHNKAMTVSFACTLFQADCTPNNVRKANSFHSVQ